MTDNSPLNTFSTQRMLHARPEAVFAAIAAAERLARWWGPAGFTNRFSHFEFRPGGRWVFDMIGPDGAVYPNESVFDHIEPDRKVVIRHVCAPHFTLTITLDPTPEGTRVGWEQVFDSVDVARAVRSIVEPANEQNLDRLAVEVARVGTG